MVSQSRFSSAVNYFHKNADKGTPVRVREKPFSVFRDWRLNVEVRRVLFTSFLLSKLRGGANPSKIEWTVDVQGMLSSKVFSFPLVNPVYTYKIEASRLHTSEKFHPHVGAELHGSRESVSSSRAGFLDVGIC